MILFIYYKMMYKGKIRFNCLWDIVEFLRRCGGIGVLCVFNFLCDDNRFFGGFVKYWMVRLRLYFYLDKWCRFYLWLGVGIYFVLVV